VCVVAVGVCLLHNSALSSSPNMNRVYPSTPSSGQRAQA
jgi:hypothetical protein